MEAFFNKSIVPASDELEIPFPIPYKPRSPDSTKDAHDLASDRISIDRRNDRRNSAYSNGIMAYDHEAVDSFVKGRDNKPRFAWVIRRGVDRSRNSKLRRDTGVSGQPSAIVQRSFSPHPSSLEREKREKGKIVSQFLPLLLVQRNAVTSLTGLGEHRHRSLSRGYLEQRDRSVSKRRRLFLIDSTRILS